VVNYGEKARVNLAIVRVVASSADRLGRMEHRDGAL
jgi:hypothetical protein